MYGAQYRQYARGDAATHACAHTLELRICGVNANGFVARGVRERGICPCQDLCRTRKIQRAKCNDDDDGYGGGSGSTAAMFMVVRSRARCAASATHARLRV